MFQTRWPTRGLLASICLGDHPVASKWHSKGHKLAEVFDNYEFISAVGSGAFGRVLRAKHRYGGQMRACKAHGGLCVVVIYFLGVVVEHTRTSTCN